jgi:hypothetical protein
MQTYPVLYDDRGLYALEIDNEFIPRYELVEILLSIPGVSNVRKRSLFSSPADIHIRFVYHGIEFIVLEPYADSSRYWIGPDDDRVREDITAIDTALKEFKGPFSNDFFSLKFFFKRQRGK